MSRFTKGLGLGAIVLAAYTGCAGQQKVVEAPGVVHKAPQQVEVTEDYLTIADAERAKARADNAYSAQEVSDIINQYQTLKMSAPEKKAGEGLENHYKASVAECEKIINTAFDNADIYAYIGVVTDKASGNKPGNYGGDRPLYVGKGKDVAEQFDMRQKIELLLKSVPKWNSWPGKTTKDRSQVYSTSIGVDPEKFGKLLEERRAFGRKDDPDACYVDQEMWIRMTDGASYHNSEVRGDRNHLRMRAAFNGYNVEQKPAAK